MVAVLCWVRNYVVVVVVDRVALLLVGSGWEKDHGLPVHCIGPWCNDPSDTMLKNDIFTPFQFCSEFQVPGTT